MVQKQTEDAFASGTVWHGRRKGVVEFVDRTHFSAVNQNQAHPADPDPDPADSPCTDPGAP